MIFDAVSTMLDVVKSLWREEEKIRQQDRDAVDDIAKACGSLANHVEERINVFVGNCLDKNFSPVHVPHYLRAMRREFEGRIPHKDAEIFLERIARAADKMDQVEHLGRAGFEELDSFEQIELLRPMHLVVGEFRALSQTLQLKR